jgi:transposase
VADEIRADYNQQLLFPPSLEDLLPAEHPARFIREFVDFLDLKQMGFKVREAEVGRPNYATDLLLKVWIYGYLERIRSSRKLERACRQHVALMWLTGMNYPDHNSLWRFWRDNRPALKEVFRSTVEIAFRADLIDMVLHAVDGTKITARGSTHQVWNKKRLGRRLQELNRWIEEAMKEVERAEKDESGEYRLPQELADKQELRKRLQEKLAEMEREKREHMNPAERDARMMKNQEGTRLAYNAQAVVDSKAGIIVAPEVSTDQNDKLQLAPMLNEVKKDLGKVADETTADSGYFSGEQLAKAEEAGYPVLVNLEGVTEPEQGGGEFHASKFVYDETNDCCICPRGEKLPYRTTVSPSDKRYAHRRYRCKSYETCPVRWQCSQEKYGRVVKISPYLGAVLRQKAKQRDPAKVALLKKRMGIVEPVFALVKHLLEFRRWTMGGLQKVRAQWFFVCSLVNLSRMYALWRNGKLRLA